MTFRGTHSQWKCLWLKQYNIKDRSLIDKSWLSKINLWRSCLYYILTKVQTVLYYFIWYNGIAVPDRQSCLENVSFVNLKFIRRKVN